MKKKIRSGDKVCVLAGKDKGKVGVVKKVFPRTDRVLVDGVQLVKCFNKKKLINGAPAVKSMPIHISNVAHIDPKDFKPTRVKVEVRDNRKLLIAKRSGEVIRVVMAGQVSEEGKAFNV